MLCSTINVVLLYDKENAYFSIVLSGMGDNLITLLLLCHLSPVNPSLICIGDPRLTVLLNRRVIYWFITYRNEILAQVKMITECSECLLKLSILLYCSFRAENGWIKMCADYYTAGTF